VGRRRRRFRYPVLTIHREPGGVNSPGDIQAVFVNVKPRRTNAPRPAWKVAKAYLQWLRTLNCGFAGPDCAGKIEAAHTPDPMSKGVATKAADCNAIPACQHHHGVQTTKGWSAVGLTRETAMAMADAYWSAWPQRLAWESENAGG
jgi:hypothetical protein